MQLIHSEEHRAQVEEVLTYLLADLPTEDRKRIERGQCKLEGGLVCPCIEVLPSSELDCEIKLVVQCTVYSIDLFKFLF